MKALTADRLRELLHYDPETGVFTRLKSAGGKAAGSAAGAPHKGGYVQLQVDGANYLAHRLAWLYMNGEWPANLVDHKDTIPNHNWWSNLRAATYATNAQNLRSAHSDNPTGLLGVSYDKERGKFAANIGVGRNKHLGRFKTAEEAHAAYIEAKRKLHEGCTI